VLNQALGDELQLPERRPAKLAAVLAACPSLEFLIDGTERPINRPKDKEAQKTYYLNLGQISGRLLCGKRLKVLPK
jgi:hypothetical protein